MTILIGLAPGSKGVAGLHLGAMLAASTVDDVVVATIVKAPWPPDPGQNDREYLALQQQVAEQSLAQARSYLGGAPLGAEYVVRQASSAAAGLLALVGEREFSMVVLGSSSAGLLGRVLIGGVAERMLHGADLPIAVAPRGFRDGPVTPVSRVNVAFGREDRDSTLLARAAAAAKGVSASVRVVCFAVRPMALAQQAVEGAAEQAVTQAWSQRLVEDVDRAWASASEPSSGGNQAQATQVETVLGEGASWDEALHDIAWRPGDVLVVGTSASPMSRFFLGSHAAKIVRSSPIPVILLARG